MDEHSASRAFRHPLHQPPAAVRARGDDDPNVIRISGDDGNALGVFHCTESSPGTSSLCRLLSVYSRGNPYNRACGHHDHDAEDGSSMGRARLPGVRGGDPAWMYFLAVFLSTPILFAMSPIETPCRLSSTISAHSMSLFTSLPRWGT